MASDFTGLKVIWPPDGTRPPQHRHDIVFVHGLHHGSITDWKNKDGICWPAEHLSLDLSTARILAFGYDDKLSLRSDGLYEGGVTLKQARDLCFALKAQSRSDRGQVPLTFVGHGTGGIIIRCALCVSHTDPAKFESILRKTKHVMFLDSPQRDLTWRKWTEIAQGSSSVHSKGQWRIWSGALDGSSNIFDNIAPRFNITSISAGSIELPTTFEGGMGTTSTLSYDNALNVPSETRLVFGELDRQTISHLSRGTIDYRQFLGSIRSGMHRIIDDEKHITHIQTWLGRRLDDTNSDMYQKNLGKYHPGTGRWLFEHPKFRSWASSEVLSPILWLTGPEGCGKSVLCALGAERIRQRTGFPAVVYIMFAYDKPRSAYHIAAQLALQLLNHVVEVRGGVTAEVLSIVAEECEDSKKLSRVYDLIKVLISQCVVVHIFLDGLDEVGSVEGPRRRRSAQDTKIEASKEHLHSTFNLLADLANREEGTPVRLWCSSRETETIGRLMRDVKAQQIPIDGKDVVADIARYFDYHLPPIIDKANTNPSGTQLLDYLQKRVGDNFLLASILINDLGAKDLSTERGIQNIIHASPSSITEIYQQRLEEMGNSISPSMLLPWAIVSIIAFAKRPLKLSELREALTISLTSTKDSHTTNLTEDDLLSLKGRTIQRDCTPFIEFTQSRDDKIDGYLRLSHASVFYFLHGLSKGPVSNVEAIVVGPNLIANACLRYLSQTRYDSITWDYFQDHHFLTYAAKYWNQHIDEAMPDPELLQATGAFVHSPQFLTLLRVQSLFLDRQFVHAERANIPKIIDTESTTEHLADKYQSFVKEWSHALRLETSNSSSNAGIEECFWGALGKENFLHTHGLTIEKNSSFLLEMQTSDEKNSDDGTAPTYCFYDKISDDGSRVAVWRMPIQVEMLAFRPAMGLRHHICLAMNKRLTIQQQWRWIRSTYGGILSTGTQRVVGHRY
ncbi:hypothetical protein P154DRAFT_273509 [Amniculicola lignicola CBS 123094]|uniref:NACHT domain-containing protein n=1 Tax=Amniculicola lignicola CBS 123094 TaxID=1392246 RepID=A0A6A5WEW7_9PLEO|nr:hypothetical protein P154DRAFT_273509 [Amniculicola lignicola CBS 123094]